MNGWKLWLSEWKHIGKNKKIMIPFLAVLLIPLIYSGMFLWAFWNPYGSMDQLPVAVVNMDEGAELSGEPLHVGDEFVDQLEDSGDFEYHVVSKEKGYQGLGNQEYYMLVEIPEDFSANAKTVMDDQPTQSQLKYVPNEGFNFLSAQIGESATEQMKAKLSSEMTETYANAMFDQFSQLKEGLAKASGQADKLNDGAAALDSGAHKIRDKLETFTKKQLQLANGTQSLRNGTSELASGSRELEAGIAQLEDGFSSLKQGSVKTSEGAGELQEGLARSKQGAIDLDEGLGKLVEKTSPMKQRAAELQQGINQLNGGANDLAASASQLAAGAGGLKDELDPLLENMPQEQKQTFLAKVEALQSGAQELEKGAAALKSGTNQINEKTVSIPDQVEALIQVQQQLKEGSAQLVAAQTGLYNGAADLAQGEQEILKHMTTFADRLSEAHKGAEEVAAGAGEVNQGASQVFDGSQQLADGSQQLKEGAGEISEGTASLTSGTEEFQKNLGEAADKAEEITVGEANSEMMASPVDVEKNSVNHVPNYGTGFTPYFLSLGLFVGALLITIVYPVREPLGMPKNAFSWFIAKFGVLLVAGVIQAVIAATVILYGLRLEVASVGYFYLFSIITSLTFMALVQMLVTWLGDPGRFIAILILILQLTTSAGTFPLELIPRPLQLFNPWLPMSYSVAGFKAVISDGNMASMWQNTSVLGAFLGGCVLLTIGYFIMAVRKNKHPFKEKFV